MAPIDRMACTRLETEHVSPFNDITIPPPANHTTSSVYNYRKVAQNQIETWSQSIV